MDTNQKITYRFMDSMRIFKGVCKNLSSSGILFVTHQNIDYGVILEIHVAPIDKSTTPTLKALVEVIRTSQIETGSYEVASQIKGLRS